jgi:putative hydrolase of HD superfamily|tara:strand:- start:53894 stop:54481 length:588 start_codon:yes stop_codon:yes gene_type:complete
MLEKFINFIKLTTDFSKVERQVLYPERKQLENDAEHSFQLAIAAWYLIDSRNLDLNKDLILKYALVHDFPEVYAGDTFIYADKKILDQKEKREEEARKRLKKELAEFADIHDYIGKYEKREDKESRFVYALDKVIPIINIYLDGGKQWREWGITLDMLIENKDPKVALSPEIKPYFDELVAILESQKDLFHVKSE